MAALCIGQLLGIWKRRSWVHVPARVEGVRQFYIAMLLFVVQVTCIVILNLRKNKWQKYFFAFTKKLPSSTLAGFEYKTDS
jgi:hypothetical protein